MDYELVSDVIDRLDKWRDGEIPMSELQELKAKLIVLTQQADAEISKRITEAARRRPLHFQ